ncbi:MAG: hypothetical protein ACFE8B_10565 [Candidatus Hermodarchaeota archaeon]
MSPSRFYDIIKTTELQVSIPKSSHFSIGTSPYYAHQHGLAIDIYHDLLLENYIALSPVSGKILMIKPLIAPKSKFSGGIDKDYLILIRNHSNPNLVWKLMHINPFGHVGDQVHIGDPLGKTIRNGYFAYWSSPHLHLEVRASHDAIRARGGKNFTLAIKAGENLKKKNKRINYEDIPVEIIDICPEFILGRFPENFYFEIPPIHGIKGAINQINKSNCLLDGGIPHYKIGTTISGQNHRFDISSPVYLGTNRIGTIYEVSKQLGFLKFDSIKFFLNNKEIRGISLYLASFLPLIKIIPYKKNEFDFSLNSTQYLSITSSSN